MSCISPISIRIKTLQGNYKGVEVPCGHCLNCLIKKQSAIEFLAKKELLSNYQKGKSASFVTLTYDDSHIPYNENGFVTLYRKDVQNFIKNMRRQIEYYGQNIDFKYLYCGEYGDGSHSTSSTGISTCRPHYHIVFIGLSPEQAKAYTKKLWRFGLCDIGPLSAGGIRYLCKYMTKAIPDKDVKALRKLCNVQSPFFYHSIGMAKDWLDKHLWDIVEHDFTFNLNGKIQLFPQYILRYVSAHTGVNYIPYVKKFIQNDIDYIQHKDSDYYSYKYEKDFLSYKYKVAALRSQNKPINDFTLSKKWVKPLHHHDRNISSLAEQAYNSIVRIVEKPKNFKIPRKAVTDVFGNINWQKYFDICYVRENVPF